MRQAEEIMRRFPCLRCGARAGEPCTSQPGQRTLSDSHADRFYSAHDAGLLPLPDDEFLERRQ